jgi:NTE family protein
VPGIWPPVTIEGSRYVDGGVYSLANADLAVGYQRVVVLAPMVDPALAAQLDAVEATGRAVVVSPDDEALAAFGADPLDPAVRAPSARAGRHQAAAAAPSLWEVWTA